ncbi:MAG: succinyl-diaminopimelate desuccinylase [Chromatiales bacterium]
MVSQGPLIRLAQDLITRPSVTPADEGCLDLIAARLGPLGFVCESMPFGEVKNLWARRGRDGPLLCFLGHTDVVPPGPEDSWSSRPFEPEVRDGVLYGRGSADMKGAIAAMLIAVEDFLETTPAPAGSIAFLLTSDEEGPAVDGTRRVIQTLAGRDETIDYCIVGEPSSDQRLADVIRVGRRGSLYGHLRLRGIQGHVAYPDKANNPIHAASAVIRMLARTTWDNGNDFFPATSCQISNIRGGTGALNVIPGEVEIEFSFRYSNEVSAPDLKRRVSRELDALGVEFDLDWTLSGEPFLTADGILVAATCKAVREITGKDPEKSTGGGTSDGRFVAPTGAQVVELGLRNATIHQVDESAAVADIELLTLVYRKLIGMLIGDGS